MAGARWVALATVLVLVGIAGKPLGAESKATSLDSSSTGRKLLQNWNWMQRSGWIQGAGMGAEGGFGSAGGFGQGGTPPGGTLSGATPGGDPNGGGFGNGNGAIPGVGSFRPPPTTVIPLVGGEGDQSGSGNPGEGLEAPPVLDLTSDEGRPPFVPQPSPPPPPPGVEAGPGLPLVPKPPIRKCFPSDANVTLRDGSSKTMEELRVGDEVATVDARGAIVFEPVYFFGHRVASGLSRFVRIQVAHSQASAAPRVLELSEGHFVHVSGGAALGCAPHDFGCRRPAHAADVRPGATLWLASTSTLARSVEAGSVVSVEVVLKRGMFNPYTMSGDIIVNGVLASSHSDWILDPLVPAKWHHHMPAVYQQLFSPLRFIYRLAGPTAVEAFHQEAAIAKKGTLAYALRELVSWPIVQRSEL